MASSLAIWAEHKISKKNHSNYNSDADFMELHFNYWSFHAKDNNTEKLVPIDYLDIGVKFFFSHTPSKICIFLPFAIDKSDFDGDLGSRIYSDDSLLSAIFNSNVKNSSSDAPNLYKDIAFGDARSQEEKIRFHVNISLPKAPNGFNAPSINTASNVTIIEFPGSIFSSTDETAIAKYFRFRINLKTHQKSSLSTIIKPADRILMNKTEEMEIVDFRVNELRNLPSTIAQNIREDRTAINCVHFFLIRDTLSEYIMAHNDYHRCRLLESNLWGKYLFDNSSGQYLIPSSDMIIYHWKKREDDEVTLVKKKKKKFKKMDIGNFSAFAKFSTSKPRENTVIPYILVIFYLSILPGLFGTFLYEDSRRLKMFFLSVIMVILIGITLYKHPKLLSALNKLLHWIKK